LRYAQGALVTVFDAEDQPERLQLRKAAAMFAANDETLGCVQARLAIDNIDDSWISRCFALEYAMLYDVNLPGLARWGLPIPLGGTSNHFRRDVLNNVLGWDPWNVTEDADLGLRLARFGFRVAMLDSTTYEEAPNTISGWINQRIRWMKGWMQTAAVHLRFGFNVSRAASPRALGPVQSFVFVLTALSAVISALFHPALIAMLGYVLFGVPGFLTLDPLSKSVWLLSLGIFVANLFISGAMVMLAAHRRGIRLKLTDPFLLIVYSGLKSVAAWIAIGEFLVDPDRWRKTVHGLATTSRNASATSGQK